MRTLEKSQESYPLQARDRQPPVPELKARDGKTQPGRKDTSKLQKDTQSHQTSYFSPPYL
nr:hypothetical protein Q903MT_gene2400 [Picea sitchensis]